jgi:arylsulfatase A-like enzyme
VPRRRLPPGFVAAPLLLVVAACGGPAPGVATADEPPPNLVLVSFDSLRADHLGTYGYPRDTSPELDRFAERSIVFERAYSTSTWTLPSHASLFSSLYPEEHGARKTDAALSENVVLLPERLASAGYRSAGVVSVGLLHRTFGFNQGWETWDDETAVPRGEDPERRRTSAVVGKRAAQLLDELAPGPFLLFVHDYDVHFDYQPPPPYDTMFEPAEAPGFDPSNFAFNETIRRDMPKLHLERLIALYDGEIRWVDHNFGLLLAELERRGLAENTAVVVVGDHGDEFFEHGEKGHANNLFNSTLQVPLIVHLPGGRHGGRRIDVPASLIDVAPTLASLAGVGPDASWSGIDLLTLLDEEAAHAPPRWVYAELGNRSNVSQRAAVRGRLKGMARFRANGLLSRTQMLFDVVADPGETFNKAPQRQARMRAISELLAAASHEFWTKQFQLGSGKVELDEDRAAELRALGYL